MNAVGIELSPFNVLIQKVKTNKYNLQEVELEKKRQYKLLGEIDNNTEILIREIHFKLINGELVPNKINETLLIRNKIKVGKPKVDPESTVDFFVKN